MSSVEVRWYVMGASLMQVTFQSATAACSSSGEFTARTCEPGRWHSYLPSLKVGWAGGGVGGDGGDGDWIGGGGDAGGDGGGGGDGLSLSLIHI